MPIVVVQSIRLFARPWIAARQASLSITISQRLLKLIPFNHLVLCHPLLLLPSIFPKSGYFPMCQLFASCGQSIGALTLASVFPMNIQGWFPLGLTGLISLLSKGLSRVFTSTIIWKHPFFWAQSSLWSNSHIHTYMTTGKTIALTIQTSSARWCLCILIHCLGLT